MAPDEAFTRAFEIQRRAGVDKEILWIHDPSDTVHSLRRSFIGRMNALNPILSPQINLSGTSFEVKESL